MSAPFSAPISTVSITAGGTSQVLLAAADGDTPRQTVIIQPQTEACLINWGGSTAGTQATGTLTAGTNPVNTETIAVNGVTFTFVTGASTSTNVHIGASKEATLAELAVVLNASANSSINVATYTVASAVLTVTYDAGGVTGNGFTLANSSGTVAITRSAATLTGGSDTVGGMALSLNQVAILNANDIPAIKGEIQVVSATTAAKIGVSYGAA